jgi:CRP-like cAMP-binding protein
MPQKLEVISRAPLFAGLDSEEAARLCSLMSERRFDAGAMIFHEGTPCDGLFLIAAGSVKIFRRSANGMEGTLAVESAPATIAELPLFDDGPYPASVSAVEPVIAYFIGKGEFRDFCRRHPEVTLKVLASVGRRLRNLLELFEGITLESVAQRLARRLLDESRKAGTDHFVIPGTPDELAASLHAVKEVVERTLSRFHEAGYLRVQGMEVGILRRDTIERAAAGEPA